MKKLTIALALFALTTSLVFPAAASLLVINSSGANLGVAAQLQCSTGLTCTKSGSIVTVTSSPTLTGTSLALSTTLAVTGNVSVNTNKFTVAASSGNTVVAGTLGVTGASTLTGATNVVGDFSVNTSNFTVAAASGNTVVGGTLAATGASTLTGGVVGGAAPQSVWMNWKPSTITSGTSTTPSATVVYMTQVFIPINSTLTGITLNNAATCGTNKYIVALFNSSGTALANSNTGGVTCSGTDAFQAIPFTGTYAVKGPGTFWIGVYVNGTTDRFRSVPAIGATGGLAGSVSGQTFGTVATVVLPTTFTADLGPVAYTY